MADAPKQNSKIIVNHNTFSKGMVLDTHPGLQPEGTYRYALNAKTNTSEWDNIGLTNEQSTIPLQSNMGTIHGMTLVEERDQWIVFHTQDGNSTVSLLHHDTGELTKVISEDEFGCDWGFDSCENLYAETKVLHPCDELLMYFSSNCKYYVLNIDELLDEGRRRCLECDDFCLFVCACVPQVDARVASTVGGKIPSGIYQFVAQLQDEDAHTTNWFRVSQPLSIGSETNQQGSISSSAIEVTVDNLDPRYNQVNIAVVKTIGGVATAEVVAKRSYSTNGTTFVYYGQKGDPLQFEEIFTKRRTWLEGQDLIQKDNRLYLYNIKQRRNLNYQTRANEIKVGGLIMAVKAEDAWKYTSLARGERYAPGIRWNHCDSSTTVGFSIPAGPAGTGNGGLANIKDINDKSNAETGVGENSYGDPDENKTLDEHRPDPDTDADPVEEVVSEGTGYMDDAENKETGDTGCLDCGEDNVNDMIDGEGPIVDPGDGGEGGEGIVNGDISTRGGGKKRAGGIKGFIKMIKEFFIDKEPKDNHQVYRSDWYKPKGRPDNEISTYPTLPDNPEVYVIGSFDFEVFESQEIYPIQCDCDGNPVYGELEGQPVKLIKVPDESVIPHYISYANGVRSQATPGVDEWKDAYAILIGYDISNIEYPEDDELHTPLCNESAFSILMADRDEANSHILAKGLATHTFKGEANGRTFAFPKHGVNSIEYVDRHIQTGTNGESRKGTDNDGVAQFNFHSADTCVDKPGLLVNEVDFMGTMYGIGFRHGQYAEGEKVEGFFRRQIDQRGTRQSINLTDLDTTNVDHRTVEGITYAKGNTVVSRVSGIDDPLMNLYRESSVYFQADSMPRALTGSNSYNYTDQSFIGDGIDHSVPIYGAEGHYAVFKKFNPSQYGGVSSMRYVDTGLNAKLNQGTTIQGIAGDVYIGPWTIRRTSYVSNRVGDELLEASPNRVNGVLRFFGFGDNTRTPDSGDSDDPKNKASLRSGINHSALTDVSTLPPNDDYYPRTLKSLVIYWGEFRMNPWLRARGEEEGEVYYDNLVELEPDSSFNNVPWHEAWLNRFYDEVIRMARWQIVLRIAIRILIFFGGAYYIIKTGATFFSLLDSFIAILRLLFLIGLWVLLWGWVFSIRNINKFMNLDESLDDRVGGQHDFGVKQWEDNYCDYNFDHSQGNLYNITYGMPKPYNTCDCDDCLNDQTTNEIFFSDKQILSSYIDSYKNFQANAYSNIPAHAGNLVRLFIRGNRFYAHTTDNIWVLQYSQREGDFRNENLYLSPTGLLLQPDEIMEHVPEGFGGLKHYTHAINTISGYYFIDEEARKIYHFVSPQDTAEISVFGLRNFFKENIPFCSDNSCIGEAAPNGIGFSMGYDHRHNRVLFTKRDGANSFTASYSAASKAWISFHSYVPQFYIWNRHSMYSVIDGAVWQHENSECSYQRFYNKFYPHIIEYSNKHGSLIPGELNHSAFYTQANICKIAGKIDVYNQKITFNKAVFYNNTQCSGELTLKTRWDGSGEENLRDQIKERPFEVELVWQGEEWRVNQIRDFVVDIDLPIWNLEPCTVEKTLNQDNISSDKSGIKTNILFDRYLINRLIFDNFDNVQLITKFGLNYDNIPIQ